MAVSLGTVVELASGKWRVGQSICSGGFGEVYQAIDPDGQPGALKFVRKSPGTEREMLLAPETRGKSNVLPTIESGEYGDRWVIAMPLAEVDLQTYIDDAEDGLPLEEALRILIDIARALVEIDGRIIHRDLKPSNVLLWNGCWHITDFGIARYADAATATETWRDAKSAPYAAPEQWRQERAESRTDVYSFGVMAYELLTARRPFLGPLMEDYKSQHLTKSPEPIQSRSIDPRMPSLVEWCLTKTPSSRPSAEMVLEQLNKIQTGGKVDGVESLVHANRIAIQVRTEREAKAEVERIARETRQQRFLAAESSYEDTVESLWQTIGEAAPALVVPLDADRLFSGSKVSLVREDEVQVSVSPIEQIEVGEWRESGLCFDLISQSGIFMQLRPRSNQVRRRASFYTWWYCDAVEEGMFRWYEMAFRSRTSTVHYNSWTDPFAVTLREIGSYFADGRGLGSPLVPIDAVDRGAFAVRWAKQIGDAFENRLPPLDIHTSREISDSYRS